MKDNEVENKYAIERANQAKSWFLKMSKLSDKLLTRLIE